MVNPAQNGTEGIERIANTVPDVALVKLGLVDIAGDMVSVHFAEELITKA